MRSLELLWQPRFIALAWGRRPTPPGFLPALRSAIAANSGELEERFDGDGLIVFARTSLPRINVQVGNCGSAVIIGDHFEAAGVESPGSLATRFGGLAVPAIQVPTWVIANGWGAYAALSRDAATGETFILRDPSGGLPVHVVDCGGAALITDQLPNWLSSAIGCALPIDRAMLANALAMPILTSHRSLLRNVTTIAAGGVASWDGASVTISQAWAPSRFCRETGESTRIREAVLKSAADWRDRHPDALLELSGGLDSAILLGALVRAGGPRQLKCVNLATSYAAGRRACACPRCRKSMVRRADRGRRARRGDGLWHPSQR